MHYHCLICDTKIKTYNPIRRFQYWLLKKYPLKHMWLAIRLSKLFYLVEFEIKSECEKCKNEIKNKESTFFMF